MTDPLDTIEEHVARFVCAKCQKPKVEHIGTTLSCIYEPLEKKVGRPSIYTQELANSICKQLAEGKSLRTICLLEDMPNASTVHAWVLEDKEDFSKQYARARELQAEYMFDEILDIADRSDNVVLNGDEKKSSAYSQNQRLKVDSRKWYLSKVLPKKFGDKLDMTTNGKDLPVPLLNALNVPNNNSNKEDSSSEKEN